MTGNIPRHAGQRKTASSADDLSHYAPIIVRSSVPTEWERKFCASIIAQQRKGQPLSVRQAEVMQRIVGKFRDATMRDDGEVVDGR